MILCIILYIIGIFSVSISLSFMFLYTNLFTMDYTILEYIKYILKRYECLQGIVGIILIVYALMKGMKK